MAFAGSEVVFLKDSLGNDVSREVLIERMKKHIYTVVGRYKGRVKGWDVVNEAIDDRDGSLRKSRYYKIIGEDFLSSWHFSLLTRPILRLSCITTTIHFPILTNEKEQLK